MSNFSSGLNGLDHAELLRQKGRINDKKRAKKKHILKRDILTGCLALSTIYALKLDREFTREEWTGILEELMRMKRRDEDKREIKEELRVG